MINLIIKEGIATYEEIVEENILNMLLLADVISRRKSFYKINKKVVDLDGIVTLYCENIEEDNF